MQPYPRSPDLVWPGHLHGTGCLSARAVGTGFPTVVRRLCLGPVRGWVWVLLTPPVLVGVLGGRVWARFVVLSLLCRLSVVFVVGVRFRPAFGSCVVAWAPRLPPAVSGSGVRCGRVCWARVLAVPSPSWLGCGVCFLRFFFFFLGVPVPALWSLSPHPLSFGWVAGSFFFFFLFVLLPATPGWVSLPVVVGGPRHSWLGSAGGGGVCCVVCGVWRWCVGGVVAGVWCGWSLATPGGGSCVLRPATPGWVSLPVVVGGPRHSWLGSAGGGGVWCVAVVCWWGCGWCVVWLVPRHSWRRFLCATPRHSWLGFAAGGGGRSPPLLAGVSWRRRCVVSGLWCVVCGGGVLVGLRLVCGVVGPSPLLAEVPVCYSPPLLAGFRCRWWWAVPATPGWGPLAALVCGVSFVVCGVWRWFVGGVVAGVWCGWSLATPGGDQRVLGSFLKMQEGKASVLSHQLLEYHLVKVTHWYGV